MGGGGVIRILVTVDSRVRMREADLPDGASEVLRKEFEYKNPQFFKKKAMGYATWGEPSFIRSWRRARDPGGTVLSVPRGGVGKVRAVLAQFGAVPAFADERQSGEQTEMPAHRVQLYDYQEAIVDAVVERENCLVRAGTGAGKTSAAIAAIARLNLPAVVVLWSGGLLEQWAMRLDKELGLRGDEVGMIRGGEFRLRPVTLAMQQTMWKLKPERWAKMNGYFGVLVADECQRVAARTYMEVFDRSTARYRIGVSAEERRKDGKEFLTYDVFGEVVAEVGQRELEERGFVLPVDVRVVPTNFDAPWYADQQMEGENPSFTRLQDELSKDAARNDLAAALAVNEARAGRRVLVFAARRDHCLEIRARLSAEGVRAGLLLGSEGAGDSEEFGRTRDGLRSGTVQVGVGTIQAIGQGIDLPEVSRGVVVAPIGSGPLFGQVRGRLCRNAPGKMEATLYYLWDRRVFGLTALRRLIKWSSGRILVAEGEGWVDPRVLIGKRGFDEGFQFE